MKPKIIYLVIIAIIVSITGGVFLPQKYISSSNQFYKKGGNSDYVSGEILVFFKQDVTDSQAEKFLNSLGLNYNKTEGINKDKQYNLKVENGKEEEVLRELRKSDLIENAILNYIDF